jgi:transcriptional regulator with XRE-family HTH domain
MLGQILQRALKDANISAPEAANFMGISEGNLYRLFKKDSFEVAYLQKAADLLKIPITHFFQEDALANMSGHVTQLGSMNQAGNSNSQKIKVSKAPTQELAAQLDSCQREVDHLKEKLVYANQTIASKDETISLLRATYSRPN